MSRQRWRLTTMLRLAVHIAAFVASVVVPLPVTVRGEPVEFPPMPSFERLLRSQSCYTPEQALAHEGERACVEGIVTNATYAERSNGQPTFLDFGPSFTVLIWGDDRPKFSPAPETLKGRRLRVTGQITVFRGKAQIVVRDPSQLSQDGATPRTATTSPTRASAPSPVLGTTSTAPASTTTASPPPTSAGTAAVAATTTRSPLAGATTSPSATPPPAVSRTVPAGTLAPSVSAAAPAATAEAGPSGVSLGLIATAVGLIAAGGAGAVWYRIRQRR